MKEKVVIITQARLGSTRLPNKVLKKIGQDELLSIHLKRLKSVKSADSIVVATTFEPGIEGIINITRRNNVSVFQGSTNDVLDRYYQSAKKAEADYVVRVTSDCPLIDPKLINEVIQKALEIKVDYCSNVLVEGFPDGQDVEVIKFSALEDAWKNCKDEFEREHVTGYIIENSDFHNKNLFKAINFDSPSSYNHIRMTVDHEEDFEAIKLLIEALGNERNWEEYTKYIISNNDKFSNQSVKRNEGYYGGK